MIKKGFEMVWKGIEMPKNIFEILRIHFEEERAPIEIIYYSFEIPKKHIEGVNCCNPSKGKYEQYLIEYSNELVLSIYM